MGSRRIWRHVDAAFMEESAIRYGKARTGSPLAKDAPGVSAEVNRMTRGKARKTTVPPARSRKHRKG